MIQDKYKELPDGMQSSEVLKYWDELLTVIECDSEEDGIDVMEALWELADRQWHSYSLLSEQYKDRIEKWIVLHWLRNSLLFVGYAGLIATHLGLPRVFELLSAAIEDEDLDAEVREDLKWRVEQMPPYIVDPYYGMRNLENQSEK